MLATDLVVIGPVIAALNILRTVEVRVVVLVQVRAPVLERLALRLDVVGQVVAVRIAHIFDVAVAAVDRDQLGLATMVETTNLVDVTLEVDPVKPLEAFVTQTSQQLANTDNPVMRHFVGVGAADIKQTTGVWICLGLAEATVLTKALHMVDAVAEHDVRYFATGALLDQLHRLGDVVEALAAMAAIAPTLLHLAGLMVMLGAVPAIIVAATIVVVVVVMDLTVAEGHTTTVAIADAE